MLDTIFPLVSHAADTLFFFSILRKQCIPLQYRSNCNVIKFQLFFYFKLSSFYKMYFKRIEN